MASIQGIYIALFGRPADPLGLKYWNEMTNDGQDLSFLIGRLTDSAEYKSRMDDKDNGQVIDMLYQSLFGRPADPAGKVYFLEQLIRGEMTLETIAINILDGAKGDDSSVIANKLKAADAFTTALNTADKIAAYVGDDAADAGREFLSGITKDAASIPSADDIKDAIDEIITPVVVPLPDVVKKTFGELSAVSQDKGALFVGDGNSATNFQITTTSLSKVELALKGYHRDEGDVAAPTSSVYKFGATDKSGFAFSVASLGTKTIKDLMVEGYSFHLKIDKDPGIRTNFVELELVSKHSNGASTKAQDSGYDWAYSTYLIKDDEGNSSVTQNIQTPIWYGAKDMGGGVVQAGHYTVSLELKKDGASVATQTIIMDIAKYDVSAATVGTLHTIAQKDGGMINGKGNSASDFSIVQIDVDQNKTPDIEIALGAQIRESGVIVPSNGIVTFAAGGSHEGANAPTFKFSVASLDDAVSLKQLLKSYDIKLLIDTDPTSRTNFMELTAEASADGVGLDWIFSDDWDYKETKNTPRLIDDAGDAYVSQNIQTLGWYQPVDENKLFSTYASAPGQYTVSLAVYEKGGTADLIGINTLVFDIANNG